MYLVIANKFLLFAYCEFGSVDIYITLLLFLEVSVVGWKFENVKEKI